MTSIAEALRSGNDLLHPVVGDDSRREAQLLLCHVLGHDRSWLYAWPERALNDAQEQQYLSILQQRADGQPVAYITGEREFWSLPFKVTRDTLIPRPETELLVASALQLVPHNQPHALLDLGTGSGAIGIALASECPDWQVTATDSSQKTLAMAQNNAARLNCSHIRYLQGNWFQALTENLSFDLILSNPPYVAEGDLHLQQGDLRFEPPGALSSGHDGLDDLRIIIGEARTWLKPHGWLLVEHGMDQGSAVRELFSNAGFHRIETRSDLAQHERMTMGCRD